MRRTPLDEFARARRVVRRGGFGGLVTAVRRQLRLRSLRRLDPDAQYAKWLEREPTLPPRLRPDAEPLSFLVLVASSEAAPSDAETTRASLEGAARRARWRMQKVAAGDALPDRVAEDLVTVVAAGDVFAPLALDRISEAAHGIECLALVYADEDLLNGNGQRVRPYCKPAWSPYLSLTAPGLFPGCPSFVASSVWNSAADRAPRLAWIDHVLRAAEEPSHRVVHVPRSLLSRRARGGSADPVLGESRDRLEAANRAARRRGLPASVAAGTQAESGILTALPGANPSVSVLIPTRDHPEHLIPLGDALEAERALEPFEILYLDHETSETNARRYLEESRHRASTRVLRFDGPFNFARMINAGARASRADVVLLLNNDILPTEPGWVARIARSACLPGVAAAGAMLLYPDRTVQHAGIALGIGIVAGHPGKRLGETSLELPPRGALREVSAATGACLAVRRSAFEAVGGLDESLAVSFNDVDLCLRLAAHGGATILDPGVRLLHFETSTRNPEVDPSETCVMLDRWPEQIAADPFFHPARTRMTEEPHFELWEDVVLSPRTRSTAVSPPARGAEPETSRHDARE